MTNQIDEGLVARIKHAIEEKKITGVIATHKKDGGFLENKIDWSSRDNFIEVMQTIFENYPIETNNEAPIVFNSGLDIDSQIRYFEAFFGKITQLKEFFDKLGVSNLVKRVPGYLKDNTYAATIIEFAPKVFDIKNIKNAIPKWYLTQRGFFDLLENRKMALEYSLNKSYSYMKNEGLYARAMKLQKFVLDLEFKHSKKGNKFFRKYKMESILKNRNLDELLQELDEEAWQIAKISMKRKRAITRNINKSTRFAWENENAARQKIDQVLYSHLGYLPNSQPETQISALEKLFKRKGGFDKAVRELKISGILRNRNYYENIESPSLRFFSWYLKNNPTMLDWIFEQLNTGNSKSVNGLTFEKKIVRLGILDILFTDSIIKYNRRFGHSGQVAGTAIYSIIDGKYRYPDATVGEYEIDNLGRAVNVQMIIDIKRGLLDGVKSQSSRNPLGDIRKYAELCNTYVILVGEYYNPTEHDKKLKEIKAEFQPYESMGKRLVVLFSDTIMYLMQDAIRAELEFDYKQNRLSETTADNIIFEATKKYDQIVRYHWAVATNSNTNELPLSPLTTPRTPYVFACYQPAIAVPELQINLAKMLFEDLDLNINI